MMPIHSLMLKRVVKQGAYIVLNFSVPNRTGMSKIRVFQLLDLLIHSTKTSLMYTERKIK